MYATGGAGDPCWTLPFPAVNSTFADISGARGD